MLIRKAPAPLVLPVSVWLISLAAGYYISFSFITYLLLFFITFLLLLLLKQNYFILLILIFICGIFRMESAQTVSPRHLRRLFTRQKSFQADVAGKIRKITRKSADYNTYIADLKTINSSKAKGQTLINSSQDFREGDLFYGLMKIEEPEGARNPGEIDRRRYYWSKGISGLGSPVGKLQLTASKPDFLQIIRNHIRDVLQKRLGESSSYAQAMLLGDTSKIDFEYRELLSRSGLSHLMAISGLHVGIVILVLISILRLFLPRRTADYLVLLLLMVYAALCDWTASVSRAAIMYFIYSISRMLERPVNINQVLAAGLFVITLFKPQQVFSIGLQLSVLATLVIINLLPYLRRMKMPRLLQYRAIKSFIITTILTFVIVLLNSPLSAAVFGGVSFNAVFGILPASVLFGLMLPMIFPVFLFPIAWQPFADSFQILLFLFNHWLKITAAFPFYIANISLNAFQVIVIYAALLCGFFLWFKKRRLLILPLILIIIAVLLYAPDRWQLEEDEMRISCLDCGQGDMSLVELNSGEKILIDTGPAKSRWSARRSLLQWLQRRHISSIDYVIITHAHNDHYGGIPAVFEALRVDNLIIDVTFWSDIEDTTFTKLVQEENCRQIILIDTCTFVLGETQLHFMHPDSAWEDANVNNHSLVLNVNYRGFNALFTGDIEKEVESELINTYGSALRADFLKAPHHGSMSSNTEEFIRLVNPQYCFIPAGKNNRFGLPDVPVVHRYGYLGENLVIGAEDGAMLLKTDGKSIDMKVMLR